MRIASAISGTAGRRDRDHHLAMARASVPAVEDSHLPAEDSRAQVHSPLAVDKHAVVNVRFAVELLGAENSYLLAVDRRKGMPEMVHIHSERQMPDADP